MFMEISTPSLPPFQVCVFSTFSFYCILLGFLRKLCSRRAILHFVIDISFCLYVCACVCVCVYKNIFILKAERNSVQN